MERDKGLWIWPSHFEHHGHLHRKAVLSCMFEVPSLLIAPTIQLQKMLNAVCLPLGTPHTAHKLR